MHMVAITVGFLVFLGRTCLFNHGALTVLRPQCSLDWSPSDGVQYPGNHGVNGRFGHMLETWTGGKPPDGGRTTRVAGRDSHHFDQAMSTGTVHDVRHKEGKLGSAQWSIALPVTIFQIIAETTFVPLPS